MKLLHTFIFIAIFGLALQASAHTFTETIRYGTTNTTDVVKLQEKLIAEGFLSGTPNGMVFDTTFNAIKNFQRANGLTPDGIVGRNTRSVLNRSNTALISAVNQPIVSLPVTTTLPNYIDQSLPVNVRIHANNEWQPLCNGASSTECINPRINGHKLHSSEALWVVTAELGTFDDSVTKLLDTQIFNCENASGCVSSYEFPQLKRCRNQRSYVDSSVMCN